MFRKCLREHLRLVSTSAFENNCGSYPPVLLIVTLISFRQRTFTQYFGPLVPLLGLFRGFPKTPNTALEGPVSALCPPPLLLNRSAQLGSMKEHILRAIYSSHPFSLYIVPESA